MTTSQHGLQSPDEMRQSGSKKAGAADSIEGPRQVSLASEKSMLSRTISSASDLERQVSIDKVVSVVVNEVMVKQAIRAVVRDCRFCVSIANPKGHDYPLIAVSEEFESMTGYQRNEILGVNCRFLNQGCDMDPADLMGLRMASETGAPYTSLLPNRKKSGELFLNLLDLRGLTVAEHSGTGEDMWFLIGIQADVTDICEGEITDEQIAELQVLADGIRVGIMKELSEMAFSGISNSTSELPELDTMVSKSSWRLLEQPRWRGGAPLGQRGARDSPGMELLLNAGSASKNDGPAVPSEPSPPRPQQEPQALSSSGAIPAPAAAPEAHAAVGGGPTASTQARQPANEGEARGDVAGAAAERALQHARSASTDWSGWLLLTFGVFALSGAMLLIRRRGWRS